MQLRKTVNFYTGLFAGAVFIMIVSRILVLTGNYNWFIDPVSLEIIYIVAMFAIVLVSSRGYLAIQKGQYLTVLGILLVHTLLWGLVFVDSKMTEVVTTHFKSQIMFVVILCVTIWASKQLAAERLLLECAYYALGLVMLTQLVTHFSEVDLSNLANIFTAKDRTRANFGFGHYNALGTSCVCLLVLMDFLSKRPRSKGKKALDVLFAVMAVVMLLCSASRSAITGLMLYYVMYYSTRLDHWRVSPTTIRVLKGIRALVIVFLLVWAVFGFDVDAFLTVAQRTHLATQTLPMFFDTGKVLLGLGFASNSAYAEGLTPYITYWMDNAYVYYLVATGFAGLTLLLAALLLIGLPIFKRRKTKEGAAVFSTLAVYAYISLFETTLFNSGGLVNYIYLPWFIFAMSDNLFFIDEPSPDKK